MNKNEIFIVSFMVIAAFSLVGAILFGGYLLFSFIYYMFYSLFISPPYSSIVLPIFIVLSILLIILSIVLSTLPGGLFDRDLFVMTKSTESYDGDFIKKVSSWSNRNMYIKKKDSLSMLGTYVPFFLSIFSFIVCYYLISNISGWPILPVITVIILFFASVSLILFLVDNLINCFYYASEVSSD